METKKRNVIPLVKQNEENKRIVDVSNLAKDVYERIATFQDAKYSFIESIKEIV